jgi:tetratricopeptide (TPR) repeat protein
MRRLFLILTVSMTATHVMYAADPQAESLILRGVAEMYNLRFDRADACFDSLIALYPEHPQGYFFKGGSYFYQIISGHRTNMPEEKFLAWNDKALEIAGGLRKKPGGEKDALFYEGAIYGNLGRYYGVQNEWTKAFLNARKSRNLHEDVLKADSACHDAKLSIGVYLYYAASLPAVVDVLAGLLGLGGDRDRGIRLLEEAYRYGHLGRLEAQFLLANIYLEVGRYEEALALFTDLAERFPENPYLINQRGVAHYLLEEFAEAEAVFQSAIGRTSDYPRAAMLAEHYLGRLAALNGRYDDAIRHCERSIRRGESQPLFKSIDSWVPPSTYYRIGETLELLHRRKEATEAYRKAARMVNGTGPVARASEERIKYPVSDFEIRFVAARDRVLTGPAKIGRDSLVLLLHHARSDRGHAKFTPQLYYYVSLALMKDGSYAQALDSLQQALRTIDLAQDEQWLEPRVRLDLARCYRQLKRQAEEERELAAVLKLDGYDGSTRIRYLAQQRLSGRKQQAP